MVDTASGSLVVDLQAHEGAVWSLAVRPDGKGFVSASADKEVKFWDFTVSAASLPGCALLCVHCAVCVDHEPPLISMDVSVPSPHIPCS